MLSERRLAMPELPEVETVARQLEPQLRGRVLKQIQILDTKRLQPLPLRAGSRVRRVYRLGKEVAIEFAVPGGESLTLLVHLRMTGRLLWFSKTGKQHSGRVRLYREGSKEADTSVRAVFRFDRGELKFADARRFGTLVCISSPTLKPGVVDPVTDDFSEPVLRELLSGSKQMIKPWLLRQDRLIGLGNIYASEILFAAKISPRRGAGGLSDAEVKRLWQCITRVLNRAIRCCGTTFSDFQQTTGEVGGFQQFLKVYDRAGLPCFVCRSPIKRLVQSRSTFYCPTCQRRSGVAAKR